MRKSKPTACTPENGTDRCHCGSSSWFVPSNGTYENVYYCSTCGVEFQPSLFSHEDQSGWWAAASATETDPDIPPAGVSVVLCHHGIKSWFGHECGDCDEGDFTEAILWGAERQYEDAIEARDLALAAYEDAELGVVDAYNALNEAKRNHHA